MTSSTTTQPPTMTLHVEGVVKHFSGLRAVDSVSLSLHQGEILGLIGPNGSGKTTLINLITGVLKPDAGRITAGTTNITRQPPHTIARAGVARTFQTIRLFRELTVQENVEVAAISAARMSRRRAREQARTALEELGIARWSRARASILPYGHERRVEIARALAMNPGFLLLDEPAAGLNEDESDELLHILTELPRRCGFGMLIIDHDMRLIMRLCNRLHVLNYGKTICEGTPDEVRSVPAVVEAYLGKMPAIVTTTERSHARC